MGETRKLKVFLCHAQEDKPIVRELYQKLAAEGWIEPWLDEEKLLPGMNWDLEIEKAVEIADAVIVCLSNNSVTKEGYVQKELKFALEIALEKPEDTIFIIPLRLDDCNLPRRLREWQYVDYFPFFNQDFAYKRLSNSLKSRAQANAEIANKMMVLEKEKTSILVQNEISQETLTLNELKILQSRIFYRSFLGEKIKTDTLWRDHLSYSKRILFGLVSFTPAFLVFLVMIMVTTGIIMVWAFPNAILILKTEPSSIKSALIYILVVWPPAFSALGVFCFILQKLYRPIIQNLIDMQVSRIKSLNEKSLNNEISSDL